MNTSVIVRRADTTDAKDLTRFNLELALETENKSLDSDRVLAGVHSLLRKPEYGFYLIAEKDGDTAGALMITHEWSDWRNGLFWWIQSVYVLPKYRRKGVYSAMHHTVRKMAKNHPEVCGIRLYVEKENQIAQQTYYSLGMEQTAYKLFEEEL